MSSEGGKDATTLFIPVERLFQGEAEVFCPRGPQVTQCSYRV